MSIGVIYAQEETRKGGTLRGQITDVTPGQNPIEGVEVKIITQDGSKEFITKTDANGRYEHAGLPAGRYLIATSKEGYNERTGKPVTIVNGGDHFVPFKMTLKGDIQPFSEVQSDERMNITVKQRIVSLLERVAESVGRRYDLGEAVVEALHQSILKSIEVMLERGGDLRVFAKSMAEGNMSLMETVLSQPDYQTAFAKHLSEVQFKDYLEFTAARRQRDQQAVVHWIAVLLDKELSLRADQCEKVVQSMLETVENNLFPISMNALGLSPQQAAQLAHYRLKVSLEGVLSEMQSKVWEGLVNANTDREHIVDVIGDIRVEQPGKQPRIELNSDKAESPEQMMKTAEAKLAAHTELLGALDERATRRLALVAKGVAQQYLEVGDEVREAISRAVEADLRQKVEDGKMTREEAAAMLKFAVRKTMDGLSDNGMSKIDIVSHPLYQQTIKDVLSEDAFARYREHQAEREHLRLQALRGVVVSCIDTQLLLDDMQREQVETAALQLVPTPLSKEKTARLMFFRLFPQTVDFEVLTRWQQGEFERVFGPMVWRR